MKKIICTTAFYRLFTLLSCAAADFKNLGFDDVSTIGMKLESDPAQVLPGWKLLLDGEPYPLIYVNPRFQPLRTSVVLFNRQQSSFPEGRSALYFHRDVRDAPVWSLEQTGTIPATAKYLTCRGGLFPMEVHINDQIIPPSDWELPPFDRTLPGRGPNRVYDVAAFAGLEVKLAFVGPYGPETVFGFAGEGYIDSITFLEDVPKITAVAPSAPGTKTNQVTLHFTPIPGRTMRVEFQDEFMRDGIWTALPSSPSTPGIIVDKSPVEHRFYRLRVEVPWLPP